MAWPSTSARSKNWGTEVLTDTDLEGQFDLLHTYINDMMNASTGHKHDGTTAEGPKIDLASGLTLASQATGDTLYASNASTWARLGIGTADQLLAVNSGATAPEWVDFSDYTTAANALSGSVVQVVNSQTGAVATGTTTIPNDDTIPQNTEGDQYLSLAITPSNTSNLLKIDVVFSGQFSAADNTHCALFQDSTAGALAASMQAFTGTSNREGALTHWMTAGTTSSTTFKVRIGGASSGTFTLNGTTSARKLGGVMASSITITEIKA